MIGIIIQILKLWLIFEFSDKAAAAAAVALLIVFPSLIKIVMFNQIGFIVQN